ncbi:hypothetical protein ASD11_13105 [Aeromicrobium sp. Root495]|uniref:type B 50S ribosomal protein L31 n=1 Tax=Aeromicrobium sp. Root495 TaxID=1736550 RepID=UPI000700A0E6|nr:type B 50S ribosomal protein L31 [Aeromicrobium sp. Root495]KQY60382.1 hypothetical protein ASD11_13105 [Aeromicrobium sp. Root495]RYJ07345.1 MAG: 50S ribosomal protein L31 [Actinomycetales bacterium]
MKNQIHPAYGRVVFRDRSTGTMTVTRSTLVDRLREGSATVEVDGEALPVLDVDVTSASHPFWTGRGRVVDSEGQVEAFRRRYGKR